MARSFFRLRGLDVLCGARAAPGVKLRHVHCSAKCHVAHDVSFMCFHVCADWLWRARAVRSAGLPFGRQKLQGLARERALR